jgi:hypothetical protein
MELTDTFEETEGVTQDYLGDVMCNATKLRFWAAIGEGRTPHRDGPPPYLEYDEEHVFIQKIQSEIIRGNNPNLFETCEIVFFLSIFLVFFHRLGK